jgi:DNA mismatch repair protein MutS
MPKLSDSEPLRAIGEQLNPCVTICERIERELQPRAAGDDSKGSVMNEGINEELDRLAEDSFWR